MANKTFWTPANAKRLDALVRGGALIVTLHKAAVILGVSYATLHAEVSRRGIAVQGRSFDWTPAKLRTLRAMTDPQGKLILPAGRAAQIIGCDKHTIVGGLLKLSGTKLQSVDDMQLRKLTDGAGHLTVPVQDAARTLRCSPKALKNAMRKLDIRPLPKFQWTPDKLALLWSVVGNDGKLTETLADAARRIGCSPRALQARLALPTSKRWVPPAAALTSRVPPPVSERPLPFQDLRALCRDGVLTITIAEAAIRFSVSHNTIRYRLKVIGAKPNAAAAQMTQARDEKLLAMCRDKTLTVPVNDAAKTLRCLPETVRRAMTRLGLKYPPRMQKRHPRAAQGPGRVTPMAAQGAPPDIGPVIAVLRQWWPALPPMLVARAVNAHPPLARMGKEKLAHRIRALAALYRIEDAAAVKLALSAPAMFSEELTALSHSHRNNARILGLERKAYHALMTSAPMLAVLSPDELAARLAWICSFLDLDLPATLSLIRREPELVLTPPGKLSAVADNLAEALLLPMSSVKTALRRKPNLFKLSPDILIRHRDTTAKLLKVSRETLTRAFIKSLALLQVKPTTISSNINASARLLNCDSARLAAAFLRRPPLLTMKPETIAARVDTLASIFLISRARIIRTVLKYPYLLTFTADNTAEKAGLLVKLSEAVGKPATPAQILAALPMAFSYAKERIALRVDLARGNLGPRSIGGLLSLSDDKANALR